MLYKRRNAIPVTKWKGGMAYDEYKKVHNILGEHNELFNMILFHNVFYNGFDWAFSITDEDIEQARLDEENEKDTSNVRVGRVKVSEQLAVIKQIAEILKYPESLEDYITVSKEFFQ